MAAVQSLPCGIIGGPIVTVTGPRRGNHCPARKMERVPVRPIGTSGTPVCAATTKAPIRKGRSPGARPKVPSGKRASNALADGLQHTIGVFDAALWVEAFDKLGPETPEQYARKELFSQLSLGHKADRTRQHCNQHQGIEITGMVDYQHRLVAGEMLQPADAYWKAKEPQQELCEVMGGSLRQDSLGKSTTAIHKAAAPMPSTLQA